MIAHALRLTLVYEWTCMFVFPAELSLITLHWFLTLFASVVDTKVGLVSVYTCGSLHYVLATRLNSDSDSISISSFQVLLRIWDQFFYEGSVVLFQVTLGMIKMKVKFHHIQSYPSYHILTYPIPSYLTLSTLSVSL